MKQLLTLKINVVVMATYVVMLMIPELLVLEDLHWWVPYLSCAFQFGCIYCTVVVLLHALRTNGA